MQINTHTVHLMDLNRRCLEGRLRRARARLWLEIAFAAAFTVAALIGCAAAQAEDYNVTIGTAGYVVSGPGGATVVAPLGSSAPHVIHVPPGFADQGKAHRLRWWLRCHPRLRMDDLGVEHFIYAKAGCEFGAARDSNYELDANGNEAD